MPVRQLQPLRGRGAGCGRGDASTVDGRCPMSQQNGGTGNPGAVQPLTTVGHATPRQDAVERVTGRATYTGDVKLSGMLYARVLRSPHPHARIRSIDVSKARALAGVKAIVTYETSPV